jgi:hypothetical protein
MSFLTGGMGFLISFFLLRRHGGIGRHILAFALGTIISLALFGISIAIQLSGRPIGNYRTEWLATVWLVAIGVSLLFQVAAMVIAMMARRKAQQSNSLLPHNE